MYLLDCFNGVRLNLLCSLLYLGLTGQIWISAGWIMAQISSIIFKAIVFIYLCCFAGISGYVATNMYKKMGGEKWVWNINLTSALFAGLYSIVNISSQYDLLNQAGVGMWFISVWWAFVITFCQSCIVCRQHFALLTL